MVSGSTISGNASGKGSEGHGGGGGIQSAGKLSVSNSTISGNTTSGDGSAIFEGNRGNSATVTSSTSSGNTSTGTGGAVSGTGSIASSIVSNTGVNCGFSDNGYNLSSDASCAGASTSKPSTNPLLGVLANNGGTTQTMMPLAGSPAIDAGGPACPATDQIGTARPQGAACDVGAVEVIPPAPTVTAISPASGPSAGGTSVTISGTGLLAGATVSIGGQPATSITVVSSASITATTPAGAAGAANVVVANPGLPPGNASATLTGGFTYQAAASPSPSPSASASPSPSASASSSPSTSTGGSNGGSAPAPATTTGVGTSAFGGTGELTLDLSTTASASGGVKVVGQAGPNTGVADLPAGYTTTLPTAGAVNAPPIDPSSIT